MYQFGDTKHLITFDPEEMRAWSVSMKVLENTHLANAPLRIAKKNKKVHIDFFKILLSPADGPFFTKMSNVFFRRIPFPGVYYRRWDCSIQYPSAKNVRSDQYNEHVKVRCGD